MPVDSEVALGFAVFRKAPSPRAVIGPAAVSLSACANLGIEFARDSALCCGARTVAGGRTASDGHRLADEAFMPALAAGTFSFSKRPPVTLVGVVMTGAGGAGRRPRVGAKSCSSPSSLSKSVSFASIFAEAVTFRSGSKIAFAGCATGAAAFRSAAVEAILVLDSAEIVELDVAFLLV